MGDAIAVAMITGAVSLAGSIMSMTVSSRKAKQQADLTLYRIDQLEQKVSRHNNYIERTYRLEERNTLHDEQIKMANHRIDDLEKIAKQERSTHEH